MRQAAERTTIEVGIGFKRDNWVRSFSRKSRAFSGKSRAFLEKALLFPSWSSFSRLKKKPGIFRKCPAFSKDARLFNHTGYTQYVLKKPGMFHQLKHLLCYDCFIFVDL
jgi:hypothetical protein